MKHTDKAKKGFAHTWSQKVTKYVGSGLREETAIVGSGRKLAGAKTDGSPLEGVSPCTTGVVRGENGGSRSTSGSVTNGGHVVPRWLRDRSASVRHERRRSAQTLADKHNKPLGLELDKQTKAILDGLPKLDPTPAIARDYLQAHANLMRLERTPQDHANSRQHYGKLRTAFRYGEVQAIHALRKASEQALRNKNLDLAKDLTLKAFERACALDWQCSTESWSAKAEAIKASGGKVVRKSKRYGKRAPTPTATAVNATLSESKVSEKLWSRHELRILTAAVFGLRPAELKHVDGVKLRVVVKGGKTFIQAGVRGAKVDGLRGHDIRILMHEVTGNLIESAGFKRLAELIGEGCTLYTTDADQRSANRVLNQLQSGLSLYSYRHALGSDLKASIGAGTVTPNEAAQYMGHRSTASLDAYGYGKKGKAGRYKAKVDGATPTVEKHKTFKPRENIHFPPRTPEKRHQVKRSHSPLVGMKPKPPK